MESRKVRYTKEVIRHSLIELLRDHPVEEITVTELCRLADINRSTFYQYYTDVYDLMRKAENALYEELYQTLQVKKGDRQYDLVLRALHSAQKNKEMYQILFTKREDKGFITRLIAPAYEMMDREYAPQMKQNRQLVQLEYDFLISGITGIWRTWINSGCELPPETVANLIDQLILSTSGCIFRMNEQTLIGS